MRYMLGKVRGLLAFLLVGPMLLSMTFCISPSYAAIPVAALFFLLVLRFSVRGIFWGMVGALGYSVFSVAAADAVFFSSMWHASFLLSLLITALTLEEAVERFQRDETYRVELEDQIEEMETSAQEKALDAQKELQGAQKEAQEAKEVAGQLRNLENTVGVEFDKLSEQNRALVAESLEHHRKIVYLEQSVQGFSEELGRLRELEATNKRRVDELNSLRTENYQLKQSIERQPEPPKKSASQVEELEERKGEAKAAYDAMLSEHNILKKSLEKLIAKKQRTPEEEAVYQEQRKAFERKKTALNQARLELIQIERELFIVKKSLQNSAR